MRRASQLGLFFLAFLFAHTLEAQLNVKIGYDLSVLDPTANNAIIARNNEKETYQSEFSSLSLFNGLQTGIRYKFDVVALEFTYGMKIKGLRAEGTNLGSGQNIENRLGYAFQRFSGGLESLFGTFGLGATIDYNIQGIKSTFEGEGSSGKLKNNSWGNTVFLSLNFEGSGNTSLSIKPFAQFFWSDWDLSTFDAQINGEAQLGITQNERFTNFGISLIFYNGPQ